MINLSRENIRPSAVRKPRFDRRRTRVFVDTADNRTHHKFASEHILIFHLKGVLFVGIGVIHRLADSAPFRMCFIVHRIDIRDEFVPEFQRFCREVIDVRAIRPRLFAGKVAV